VRSPRCGTSAARCWQYYWKSADLPALDDDLSNALLEHASRIRSPWTYAVLFHLGGAIADVGQDTTAYSHRHAAHSLNINGVWLPNQSGQDEIAWSREFFSAVQPHQVGTYINFLDRDDADRVPAAYGEATYGEATYRRLVALKDRHDPDNVLSLPNRPSSQRTSSRSSMRASLIRSPTSAASRATA